MVNGRQPIGPADMDFNELAMMREMQKQQQQQQIKQQVAATISGTCVAVYAGLVCQMIQQNDGERPSQQALRDAARMAKDCAPYPAEAAGMIVVKDEEPGD